MLQGLRTWDRLAAERPDVLVTNSRLSQTRIKRYYRRDAEILHPPVDTDEIIPLGTAGSFWLAGGRLVGYKRFDLIVQAFAKLDMPLKIFGIGPEEKKLRASAGSHTEFLGHVSDDAKKSLYQQCIGFIHPQVEDFGIAAVEAMAAGKPVIAYGRGGGAETILDGVTGTFIEAQTWVDIGDAVIRFDVRRFDPAAIRAHAMTFSKRRFEEGMRACIERVIHTA